MLHLINCVIYQRKLGMSKYTALNPI